MSSIAAASGREETPALDSISRMLAAAPHRGPAGAMLAHGMVILGITNGPVPWASLGTAEGWACAIHGPIDNADALGTSDYGGNVASAIAFLFSKHGPAAADHLRGAFAGVATDGQQVICFRDHLGGRPLFFRQDSERTWVATEAKQVVAGAGMSRQPDLEAIESMFYRGTSDQSAVKGVSRVYPAQTVTLTPGKQPSKVRFWRPEEVVESRRVSADEAVDLLTIQVEKAVVRTVSGADAVALSGGIDSPTLAAFAAPEHLRRSNTPLSAYTAVYPHHKTVDEWEYTREVAEYLGIEVTPYEPAVGTLDDVESWVDVADGPWDSTPMATLSEGMRLAAKLGARQVLMGTLAEYVFTINRFLLGHLLLRGRFSALETLLAARRKAGRSVLSLGKQLAWEITPAPMARLYASATRHRSRVHPPWIDMAIMGAPKYMTQLAAPARQRWIQPTVDATRGMTSTQEAVEICAAVAGVTVRQPLADRDLWEFFLSLPVEAKFVDVTPKAIIRRMMRGRLPDVILDRRHKTVFDEHVLDTTPWSRISELIDDSDYQMPGVDYKLLKERIVDRTAAAAEIAWAHDLAVVHAFMKLFR